MKNDDALRVRARKVIPGGMYGHMATGRALPKSYPQFFSRAEGCRIWDVDDNEYIDFMCSYGPMIAGYGNPRIRAAADAQRDRFDIANGPPAAQIDLAERLVGQVGHADWASFQKNGNDATTVCNMVARAKDGKNKILVATGAYHGSQPWANRFSPGVAEGAHANYPTFTYNDADSLREAAASWSGDIAGIFVSAFKHDAGFAQELCDPSFARAVREVCDAEGAALILDDVRAGLRLSLDTSWSVHGVQPDLSAWGKALANGEPVAAVLGNETYREAAAKIFATGSFWYQAAPFAAALVTLDVLEEADAPNRMRELGQAFRDGLEDQSKRYGHPIGQTGPPQMPAVLFDDDPKFKKGLAFCEHGLANGVYLHPGHNMFLSVAHTERDIEQALGATARAFQALG